jgi:hypothetical protein
MQEILGDTIEGLHIYRFITPTRIVCSLLPSGGVGVMEVEDALTVTDTPATLRFESPMPGHRVQWCSARKCFLMV